MAEPEIPQIPIKITRKDNKLKLVVDKYTLELKELEGYSQQYDFVLLEQFLTKTAQIMYTKIVQAQKQKEEFRKAFLEADEFEQDKKIVGELLKNSGMEE
jgi:hypothetical protein